LNHNAIIQQSDRGYKRKPEKTGRPGWQLLIWGIKDEILKIIEPGTAEKEEP
jgi:hypothetical protein